MTLRRIVLGAMLGATLFGTDAMAVEEPAFRSVLHEGAFEVRDYPALVVAEVTVSGDQKETAPVAQAPTSEKIAMTAPVTQIQSAGEWVVRFTMPSAYSMDTLPEPNDPKVHLRALPPARFAVLQFSGLARKDDVAAKTAELEKLARTHHLRAIGPASLAQYDPPWTLWFMRRNEVMIPIAPK